MANQGNNPYSLGLMGDLPKPELQAAKSELKAVLSKSMKVVDMEEAVSLKELAQHAYDVKLIKYIDYLSI